MSASVSQSFYSSAVLYNAAIILNNIKTWANKTIGEVRHQLGIAGNNAASYNGWAIQHGAPQTAIGAWNWYLQNKVLAGRAPVPYVPPGSFRWHRSGYRGRTRTKIPIVQQPSPWPAVGSLNLITNNLMTYTSSLQTQLNLMHLPMPTNFVDWVNTVANYGAVPDHNLALVNLYNAVEELVKWLPTMQSRLKALTVATQQAQQAQAAQALAAKTTSPTVQQAASATATALSTASQAVTVATQNPTTNNVKAANTLSNKAASSVAKLNSATGNSSKMPLYLIGGALALKMAGVLTF